MTDEPHDEPPPFFSTWGKLYTLVLIVLFIVISLLYWLTELYVEDRA